MRRICLTSLKQNLLLALGAVLILAVAAVLFLFMLQVEPDHFDGAAQLGVPTDPDMEVYGYQTFEALGVCEVALCGQPAIDGRDVGIYLTNPASNTVAIKLEIYTPLMVQKSDGTYEPVPDVLLGESGFIRPGEYIETVRLKRAPETPRTNVMLKIATLDEETGRSNGYFFVNTVLVK